MVLGQVPANRESNCAKNFETGEELARDEDIETPSQLVPMKAFSF